ncbi:MAG: GTPase Era [Oscillospiraceae bacterium]|jgi:GTP-binding protein Era|nr:GTPase Era [Oscillospiraceae bacterium]
METGMETKTAMITLAGRPNVGKSTLINALAGEKIAIVTNKPQTTRSRIFGIVNRGNTQLVFVDTPGFHRAKTRLGDYMVGVVRQSVADVDAVALVVEPIANVGTPEHILLNHIASVGVPATLIINKIDTVKKPSLLEVMAAYSAFYEFDAIIPVSAKFGAGLDDLFKVLEGYAVSGPKLFPDGAVTDQPDKIIIAELIREKLLTCLDREVPHGIAVEVSRLHGRDDGIIDADAVIYCERERHVGIIIGKDGLMLKNVGTLARADIEKFLGAQVFLRMWVHVKDGWRDNSRLISELGFPL